MVEAMRTHAYDDFYSPLFEPELIPLDRAQIAVIVLICVVAGVFSIIAYWAARRPEHLP